MALVNMSFRIDAELKDAFMAAAKSMDRNGSLLWIAGLGILQSIISRMASNSFYIKGWDLTIFIGVIALKKNITHYGNSIFWALIVTSVSFFLLDAYYLQQERAFRNFIWKEKRWWKCQLSLNISRTGRQTGYASCYPGKLIWALSKYQYGSDEPLTHNRPEENKL